MNQARVSWVLIVLLFTGICLAQVKGSVTLTGLELAADKTDIERLPIKLNEKFSPSTFNYTVTVDASYTANMFITPKLSSGDYGSLKINGADVKPGEPYKVKVNPGENKFSITADASATKTCT
jgi:hypothetical protein